jgi:hypothetical protein
LFELVSFEDLMVSSDDDDDGDDEDSLAAVPREKLARVAEVPVRADARAAADLNERKRRALAADLSRCVTNAREEEMASHAAKGRRLIALVTTNCLKKNNDLEGAQLRRTADILAAVADTSAAVATVEEAKRSEFERKSTDIRAGARFVASGNYVPATQAQAAKADLSVTPVDLQQVRREQVSANLLRARATVGVP